MISDCHIPHIQPHSGYGASWGGCKTAISDTKNVMAPRRFFSRPFSTLRLPQRFLVLTHRPPPLPCSTWCCITRPRCLCGLLGAWGVLISDTKCPFLIRKPDGAPARAFLPLRLTLYFLLLAQSPPRLPCSLGCCMPRPHSLPTTESDSAEWRNAHF